MFEFTLACKGNGDYQCPPDAGSAWREAFELGFDMFELEENLKLTPSERLEKHQRKLDEWFQFESFMEIIYRGSKFITSHHGNPS